MAGAFGRSRSKVFQSGGSCTSSNKRRVVKRNKAGSARNHQPTRNKCKVSLKAGRGKSQHQQHHQGSDSGSSQESSSSSSSPSPTTTPTSSSKSKSCSKFKTCNRRRRRKRPKPKPKQPQIPYPTPRTTTTTILHRFRDGAHKSTSTVKETVLSPSSSSTAFIAFFNRTCKKDGRISSPSINTNIVVFKSTSYESQRRRDRRGARRPHCPFHRPKRSPQQSLHRQRPPRPPCAPGSAHRHPILRRPGPPRLRPPQQGRRLAYKKSQGRHRPARRAPAMEPRRRFNATAAARSR